ncbi:MAG: hypothetical protein STSR0006_18720 [Lentimicrobium sp.]|jgi:hypothetical protein
MIYNGIAKKFRKRLGCILKIDFGKNSANTSTMMVDMIVCIKTIKPVDWIFPRPIFGKISLERMGSMARLNTTRVIVFPSSRVAMKLEGFSRNLESILADHDLLFLAKAILSLLAVKNAISDPENKAEKMSEVMTMI